MKKFLGRFLLTALILSSQAFAAGTVTITRTIVPATYTQAKIIEKVTIDWVADASAATIPATTLSLYGFVTKAVTNPGSVAPTANYDIDFGDPEDSTLDLLAGALANRHTTTTEQVYPAIAASPGTVTAFRPYAAGTYTLHVTNNSVNSATGRIVLYLER